jgi:hypothetical protein
VKIILLFAVKEQNGRPDPIGPHGRSDAFHAALFDPRNDGLIDKAPFDRSAARAGRHPLVMQSPMLGRIFIGQGERFDGEVWLGIRHGCLLWTVVADGKRKGKPRVLRVPAHVGAVPLYP